MNERRPFKCFLEDIFRELSKYVHHPGETLKLSFYDYDTEEIKGWFDIFNKVNISIGLSCFINFPKLLKEPKKNLFFDENQITWLKNKKTRR